MKSLRLALLATAIAASLTGCAYDMVGLNSSAQGGGTTAGQPASLPTLPQFLGRLESARGKALTVTERAAVSGIAVETKGLLNGTQNRFFDVLGQASGINSDAIKLLVPDAAKPIGNSELVSKLESKLGRKLGTADAAMIKTANTLRSGSLESLKDGFADKVGNRTGVGKETVLALMPLLGF